MMSSMTINDLLEHFYAPTTSNIQVLLSAGGAQRSIHLSLGEKGGSQEAQPPGWGVEENKGEKIIP
jgi:hypothetical protein